MDTPAKTRKPQKLPLSSKLMYTAGFFILLIALASFALNMSLFYKTLSQYVSQGYPASIFKDIFIVQLLPALFQTVAGYLGTAFLLLAAGLINHRLSKLLVLSADPDDDENQSWQEVK